MYFQIQVDEEDVQDLLELLSNMRENYEEQCDDVDIDPDERGWGLTVIRMIDRYVGRIEEGRPHYSDGSTTPPNGSLIEGGE